MMIAQRDLDKEGQAQQAYLVSYLPSWPLPTLDSFYSSETKGCK